MEVNILKELVDRNTFISHLESDIINNESTLITAKRNRDEFNTIIDNLNELGLYPEKEALIPLSKNIYMKGRIVHTGEYYVHKVAHPDSYIFLNTLNQAVNSLETQITSIERDINKANYANDQLNERLKLLKGNEKIKNDELPKEIRSEKGIAVRVGEYYDILEFEE